MKTSIESQHIKYRKCPICNSNEAILLRNIVNTDLVRCKQCSMVFADIDNTDIHEKNQYVEATFMQYLQSEPVFSLCYYDAILDKIAKCFPDKKEIKILDFGCGAGFFLCRARKKGFNVRGIDFSPYSQLAKDYFGLDITVGDIFKAPFPTEEFDVIISHATFEHLSDIKGIGTKVIEYLKPNGVFIISGVPNYNTIGINIFGNFFNNTPPDHVNFFEKKSLANLFTEMSLKPFNARSYGFNVWLPLYYLRRLFGSKKKQASSDKTASQNDTQNSVEKITLDIETSAMQRFVTKIYEVLHLPGMGQSLEMWGRKKA